MIAAAVLDVLHELTTIPWYRMLSAQNTTASAIPAADKSTRKTTNCSAYRIRAVTARTENWSR